MSYRIYEKTQLTHVHCRNILIVLKKNKRIQVALKRKEKRKKKTQERKYLHQLAVHFCLACMNKNISAVWKCSWTYTKSSMDPDYICMLELKWSILLNKSEKSMWKNLQQLGNLEGKSTILSINYGYIHIILRRQSMFQVHCTSCHSLTYLQNNWDLLASIVYTYNNTCLFP